MPSALYSMNSITCLTRCTASKNIEESIATHSPPGVTINNRIVAKFILIFSRAALSSTLWAVCQGLAVERSALMKTALHLMKQHEQVKTVDQLIDTMFYNHA